jgi:hypothetical protein
MSNVQYHTIIEMHHQCNLSFGHQFQQFLCDAYSLSHGLIQLLLFHL